MLCRGVHSEAALSSERGGDAQVPQRPLDEARQLWDYDSESGSDSDPDRPDPDLVLDDLASRRFHSPTPTTPTNFAVPLSPLTLGSLSRARCGSWSKVNMVSSVPSPQSVTVLRSENKPSDPCDFCWLFDCFFPVPVWMRANLNASLALQFAWFTVTVSDSFWLWVLFLTPSSCVGFWSCFEFFLLFFFKPRQLGGSDLARRTESLLDSFFCSFCSVVFQACVGLLIPCIRLPSEVLSCLWRLLPFGFFLSGCRAVLQKKQKPKTKKKKRTLLTCVS